MYISEYQFDFTVSYAKHLLVDLLLRGFKT
ncbi:MAG: hypothetical protein ACI9SB_001561 [Candidatus Azotimanducaceae bacterium]|jgi:hypothetical protein